MAEPERTPLADRINVEPPILNGMSQSEVSFVGLLCLAGYGLIGIVLSVATGVWPLLVGATVIGPILTVWMLSNHMAVIKRNRPDGYYPQVVSAWLVRMGLRQPRLVLHDGHWSLGRTG